MATVADMLSANVSNGSRHGRSGLRSVTSYLGLLLAVLLLAGCSSTRFMYNQLDWVTVWYLDDFFSLTKEQEDELRALVDRNLQWHRTTQLPRYAEFCRELDREAAGQITPATLMARYDQMLVFWDDFMLHIIPDTEAFLLSLTPEQIDEMFERLDRSNKEFYEEYSGETPELRKRRRDKAAVRGMERITGRLSAEQRTFVEVSIAGMEDASEDWIGNRRTWQTGFRKLLDERPPNPEFRERLTELFVYPRNTHPPGYQQRVETNLRIFMEMMATLIDQLDERQHARMSRRLKNYAKDFELLAART